MSSERESSRHYVYLLTCSDGTIYGGYTTDLKRRLRQHNDGRGAKYTRSRRPVTLSYVEETDSRSQGLKREYALKRLPRREKLRLIKEYQLRHGK
ncbi:MAG: GIY-YIG nuclease family protein [Tissierellia bacterium]|nr:GIY-YIG nuclease family protein [Tissierellia bacterium]